jgi:hypothetical protein
MTNSRRQFIKQTALATTGVALATNRLSASSYKKIIGANDRVRVGAGQTHLNIFKEDIF